MLMMMSTKMMMMSTKMVMMSTKVVMMSTKMMMMSTKMMIMSTKKQGRGWPKFLKVTTAEQTPRCRVAKYSQIYIAILGNDLTHPKHLDQPKYLHILPFSETQKNRTLRPTWESQNSCDFACGKKVWIQEWMVLWGENLNIWSFSTLKLPFLYSILFGHI